MKKGGEAVDVDLRRGLGEALHNYTVGFVHLFSYISPFFLVSTHHCRMNAYMISILLSLFHNINILAVPLIAQFNYTHHPPLTIPLPCLLFYPGPS